jgi:NAD(P)H-dependent FMN reductase
MSVITLAVLMGTTRQQRQSDNVARYIADFAKSIDDVEVILVDPRDFTFRGDGNDPEGKDPAYSNITRRADAFFI